MLQTCTAAGTGTAGCAGMILQQEGMPPRTALITFLALTPQVSSESFTISIKSLSNVLTVDCY